MAVQAIYARAPVPGGSREELCRLVEAVCVGSEAVELARRLHLECHQHINSKLSALAAATTNTADDDAFLAQVATAWREYCEAMREIGALFLYLDRTHIFPQRSGGVRSLWDHGLQIFRTCLPSAVQKRALDGIAGLLNKERQGSGVTTQTRPDSLLADLVSMCSSIRIYANDLEPKLIESAAAFYEEESRELRSRSKLAEYIAHCDRRLQEEARRCEVYLEPRTRTELLARTREELLRKPGAALLSGDGFFELVREKHVDDLKLLYQLFGLVDLVPEVRKSWTSSVKKAGALAMQLAEDPEECRCVVPALIDLRRHLIRILAESFEDLSAFSLALKDAFEEFVNSSGQNLPAKLLARHVDELLRNEKACPEHELEDGLEQVVGIFRYISAKDTFEAFYKKDLAKRLLLGRSSSMDAELAMVQKLKTECGSGFTSKIEGMFRDIELSKDLLTSFAAREAPKAILDEHGFDFGASVLTSGLWPAQPPSPEITFPQAISSLQHLFSAFYSERCAGRTLKWSPTQGLCTLRASFDGNCKKEVVVSILQAIVLLLFNGSDTFSCKAIADATRIPTADLHRTLVSLSMHKHIKLLVKEPKAREVSDDDVFTFNSTFTHKLFRVAVPHIAAKEQHEEEANVEQRVCEDRQLEVDAAVVRIMKQKRKLAHQQLVAEVFRAVMFPVTASDAKRRIESLIEREYLERDPSEPSTYTYLA